MSRNSAVAIAESDNDNDHQFLTFVLEKEMFAIGIRKIREIMEYGELTTVPMMPSYVRGVINLRGSVVPVVDLNARFGRGRTVINRRSCIVIIEIGTDDQQQELGIIVDGVSEVRDIPPTEIEPPPAFGAKIRTDFISGMGKVDGSFVVMLDVDCVLDVEEMAELAGLQEDHAGAHGAQG